MYQWLNLSYACSQLYVAFVSDLTCPNDKTILKWDLEPNPDLDS